MPDCCFLKIVYYVGSIAYHIADFVSDWSEYFVEIDQKTHFAGVANIHKEVDNVILFTCITGTISGVLIAALYVYYIWFHFHIKCSYKVSYKQLLNEANEGLLTCDERGDEDKGSKPAVCQRYVVGFELVVSIFRLLLKESLQAGLLFYFAIQNDSNMIHPEWPDILFAICSVLGNCKLLFCFSAKYLGVGSGKKCCLCNDHFKKCVCLVGCLVSLACGLLTVIYLIKAGSSWFNISHQID